MRASVFVLLSITLVSSQKSKDTDEGRPYEFGFTIDGQQHRHEKKDSNGIIQGEFGFITADGVYHVTVYATDENGNFKILSMKNIRVSAPLDGSPALGPISPEASKYIGKQNPPSSTQPPQQFQKLQQQPSTQATRVTSFQGFTTQPTIRPACAGCGYVTTAKPIPGQPFGAHNGGFPRGPQVQNSFGGNNIDLNRQPIPGQPLTAQNGGFPQSPQQGTSQNGFSGESIDLTRTPDAEVIPPGIQGTTGIQGYPNPPNGQPANQQSQIQIPGHRPNAEYQQNSGTGPKQLPNLQNRFQTSSNGQGSGQTPIGQISSLPTGPNQLGTNVGSIDPSVQSQQITQLPPIAVKENVIHVGGQNPQDITIQDKYPGMVDGLPDGIEEKDITNILYKFKYIVGFHGHWERGLKNGAKIGGYFVNGRDGISRVVNYIADENGYRPKFKFINLGLDSDETPKEGSEKKFGLKSFEFMWYPLE